MDKQMKKSGKVSFKRCGMVKVEEHPEVSSVYRREKHQVSYYCNSMAEPEANIIVLR